MPNPARASVAFASTNYHRSWDIDSLTEPSSSPERVGTVFLRDSPSPSQPLATWSSGEQVLPDGADNVAHYQQPRQGPSSHDGVTTNHPYSVLAYRARLQHGRFHSILELSRAPYAPEPLQVLTDLLQFASQGGRIKAAAGLSGDGATAPPPQISVLNDDGLVRVQSTLAKAADIKRLLGDAYEEVREAVSSATTIGDKESHIALQKMEEAIQTLFDVVSACYVPGAAAMEHSPSSPLRVSHSEEAHRALTTEFKVRLAWKIPLATHVAVMQGILGMSSAAGLRLVAITALERLLELHRVPTNEDESEKMVSVAPQSSSSASLPNPDVEESSFALDDVLDIVEGEAQSYVEPLQATHHILGMEACAKPQSRDFTTALSLYRRFARQAQDAVFPVTADDFASALMALAHSCRSTTDFEQLRALMLECEAASVVPVSVPLYSALIDAVSRADESPQRMSIALSLYRRLRDGGLTPTTDTYAALIACCASTREPTHAFAFYHEARQICNPSHFSPRVYTNLLRSYATSGYAADARTTLDVLVEAGAPLVRSSFHAVLACAVTLREAQEVVDLMTQRYHIIATPHTFAFLQQAAAKSPAGVSTVLHLFDFHEQALASLAELLPRDTTHQIDISSVATGGDGKIARSSTAEGVALESLLLEKYPLYVRSVEQALMRLRIDPTVDARLLPYLTPLIRIVQQRMNAFVEMAPQSPTYIPARARICVAVLASDVLANIDEWVMPFVEYYSSIVIPYSALLMLQKGSGHRINGVMPYGTQAGCHDEVWQDAGSGGEHATIVEHRRRRLVRFLEDYRSVIHLMSLEEELRWSRDIRRYSIGVSDWFGRTAACAIHLARSDIPHKAAVYASHENIDVILVTANFERCGRFVTALKKEYRYRDRRQVDGAGLSGRKSLAGALQRVFYHNPRSQPNWTPPAVTAKDHATPLSDLENSLHEGNDTELASPLGNNIAKRVMGRENAATFCQNSDIAQSSRSKILSDGSASEAEERLDADILMSLLCSDAGDGGDGAGIIS